MTIVGVQDIATQMLEIRIRWRAAIGSACSTSSVPPEFLAALVANESGGNPYARRFEPAVLVDLWQVLMGRYASFGSIGRADIMRALGLSASSLTAVLDGLASSIGLTQIMGYNALDVTTGRVFDLTRPTVNLNTAIRLLVAFAQRFELDLAKDFEQLFRCWNTGRPDGTTADPNYVANGLARLAAYRKLLLAAPAVS